MLLILVALPLGSVLVTAVTGYRDDPSALGNIFTGHTLKVTGKTIWLSVLMVSFATLFAGPLALLRSWTRFRTAGWIEIFILIPFMTPPFALAIAWMDFTRLGGVADMLLGKPLAAWPTM